MLAALVPFTFASAQQNSLRALEAAAGKGDTRALMRLAAMYEMAEGVPANFARSIRSAGSRGARPCGG